MKYLWMIVIMGFLLITPSMQAAGKWRDLSSYPRSNQVWLGTYGGEVEVSPRSELIAARHGELRWSVQHEAIAPEGSVVAYFSAEKLDQSASQLKLLENSHTVKLQELEWSHAEKVRGLKKQAAELKSEISQMVLSAEEQRLVGDKLMQRLNAQRAEMESELEELHDKLNPDFLKLQLEIKVGEINLELERARLEHQSLLQSLAIIADHEGVVHHLKDGQVRSGMVVGEIERRGWAIAKLKVLDPEIRNEPEDQLSISVFGPNGRRVKGTFSQRERIGMQRIGPTVYSFDLKAEPGQLIDPELGGERMIDVYRNLKEEAFIVSKSKLLFSDPKKVQELGWHRFVKSIWPDAEILHIGPNTIALTTES